MNIYVSGIPERVLQLQSGSTLHLNVSNKKDADYFTQMWQKDKIEEFREYKPFWITKVEKGSYKYLEIRQGFNYPIPFMKFVYQKPNIQDGYTTDPLLKGRVYAFSLSQEVQRGIIVSKKVFMISKKNLNKCSRHK